MLSLAQVATPAEAAAAQTLLREYLAAMVGAGAFYSNAPTFHRLEEELLSLPGIYSPPAGRLLLAWLDGQPAGCVALKPVDATTGELKRLYVRPVHRAAGIGRALVERLLDEARLAGYTRVVLDSHRSMTAAHAVYRALGFREVAPPDDFPAALKPEVIFMACSLAPTALPGA